MNRSIIGEILQSYGMELYPYSMKDGRTYHVYRKPSRWNTCELASDMFWIRGIQDIYLCANQILVTGLGNLEITIPYKFLDDIRIIGSEEI